MKRMVSVVLALAMILLLCGASPAPVSSSVTYPEMAESDKNIARQIYPELAGVDMTGWTILDWDRFMSDYHSRRQQENQRFFARLEELGFTVSDYELLCTVYSTPDFLYKQSDKTLKNKLWMLKNPAPPSSAESSLPVSSAASSAAQSLPPATVPSAPAVPSVPELTTVPPLPPEEHTDIFTDEYVICRTLCGKVVEKSGQLFCPLCENRHQMSSLYFVSEKQTTLLIRGGTDAVFGVLSDSSSETSLIMLMDVSFTNVHGGNAVRRIQQVSAPASASAAPSTDNRTAPDFSGYPAVKANAGAKRLTEKDLSVNGITAGTTQNQLIKKLGQPAEVLYLNEKLLRIKRYVYDGVSFDFVCQEGRENGRLWEAPAQSDKVWRAVITGTDNLAPRGIKIGDSIPAVLRKFPQEQDYRTKEAYGRFYGEWEGSRGYISMYGPSIMLVVENINRSRVQADLNSDGKVKRIEVVFSYYGD